MFVLLILLHFLDLIVVSQQSYWKTDGLQV